MNETKGFQEFKTIDSVTAQTTLASKISAILDEIAELEPIVRRYNELKTKLRQYCLEKDRIKNLPIKREITENTSKWILDHWEIVIQEIERTTYDIPKEIKEQYKRKEVIHRVTWKQR